MHRRSVEHGIWKEVRDGVSAARAAVKMCPSLRGVTVASGVMKGHRHSEGGAGDYTASCLGFGFINEAVGLTATEAAMGFALARAAASVTRLSASCGHDENGGGISLPHAGCCSGSELAGGVSTMELPCSPSPHRPQLCCRVQRWGRRCCHYGYNGGFQVTRNSPPVSSLFHHHCHRYRRWRIHIESRRL